MTGNVGSVDGPKTGISDLIFSALLDARYRIIERISAGHVTEVYLAYDLDRDRKVALKILRKELAEVLGDRFLREIEITTSLEHQNIVTVFGSGTVENVPYFVMSFIDGESLEAKLDRDGAMPIAEAAQLAAVVGNALSYAHGRGVIHRDVKPGNILLRDDVPFVTDFGIALPLQDQRRLTLAGTTLGTPAYVSPEQVVSPSEVDARSDIYSLACTLFAMLAGSPPFEAPDFQSMMIKHALDPVPSIRDIRQGVSPGLANVMTRAMAKAPEGRFASMKTFVTALKKV